MLCPRCGKNVGDSPTLCEACVAAMPEDEENPAGSIGRITPKRIAKEVTAEERARYEQEKAEYYADKERRESGIHSIPVVRGEAPRTSLVPLMLFLLLVAAVAVTGIGVYYLRNPQSISGVIPAATESRPQDPFEHIRVPPKEELKSGEAFGYLKIDSELLVLKALHVEYVGSSRVLRIQALADLTTEPVLEVALELKTAALDCARSSFKTISVSVLVDGQMTVLFTDPFDRPAIYSETPVLTCVDSKLKAVLQGERLLIKGGKPKTVSWQIVAETPIQR